MSKMILAPATRHTISCSFGCCGPLAAKPKRRNDATRRTKKALKARDRQAARARIQEYFK